MQISRKTIEIWKINVIFENIEVKNINIKGKDSLIRIAPIIFKGLSLIFTSGVYYQVKMSLGAIFSINSNTDYFGLENSNFTFNKGRIFQFTPTDIANTYNQLSASVLNSTFYSNSGEDALIYISGNSKVTI